MKYLSPFFFLLASLCLLLDLRGQQLPALTSQLYQANLYNPAALSQGGVTLVHRRQWLNFDADYLPTTYALNADLSPFLGNSDWMSVGVNLTGDAIHIFRRNTADLLLGFHLYTSEEHQFSLGAIAGFGQQSIDFSRLPEDGIHDQALYTGDGSTWSFAGGFGAYYEYTGGQNRLSASLAIPQLFTSELSADDFDQDFAQRFHVLANLRYKMNFDLFSLEPSLLFRGTNGELELLTKSTTDLAVRAHFLEGRLWVSGGYRLNGETVFGGVGIDVAQKIQLQTYYEQHRVLGGSPEIALIIPFRKTRRVALPLVIANILDAQQEKINQSLKTNLPRLGEVATALNQAERSFDQSEYEGLGQDEIIGKLAATKSHLQETRKQLNPVISTTEYGMYANWESKRAATEAEQEGAKSELLERRLKQIEADANLLLQQSSIEISKYERLVDQYSERSEQLGAERSLTSIIVSRDFSALNVYLQERLRQVPGLGEETTVTVDGVGDLLIVTYEFPYLENTYELIPKASSKSLLLDQVGKQVRAIESLNTSIGEVGIRMNLQDDLEVVDEVKTQYPYLGELGSILYIGIGWVDTEEKIRQPKTIMVQEGDPTSLVDLAALKLLDVQNFIRSLNLNNAPGVQLEVTGPNYDQSESQMMQIEFTFNL